MKRNKGYTLALIAVVALAFGSGVAQARPHWGNGYGMGGQGYSQLTPEQQTTLQKLHADHYAQTSALRQQLMSKRYEYNALLTASSPDSAKIEAVANEMVTLNQQLDQQRVKFDVALAQSGVPRAAGMGYGGCGGGMGMHRGGGMGMGRW
ncbi:zinc resistance sensor/chaperone ZraP [Trabulsiella odontotermitis]|uniref:Zinc resistance-associated protein n=1 Tax=Trabulsiella odontotermitis TaxID=379893 RepID=A0A0L0GI69_9ENTR|nr:zinc resistance sensor/chaperone ZraP [Trabulsiella odontotermitis]KNC88657.1 zinc resistance protein [Trabulsiella odontotermitis]